MKKYIFILSFGLGIFLLPHFSLADTLVYSSSSYGLSWTYYEPSSVTTSSIGFVSPIAENTTTTFVFNTASASGSGGEISCGISTGLKIYSDSAYTDLIQTIGYGSFINVTVNGGDSSNTSSFYSSTPLDAGYWQLGYATVGCVNGSQSASVSNLAIYQDAFVPTYGTMSFLFPTNGTTTSMFDNFALQAVGVTSTDNYNFQLQWYLPYTQTTQFTALEFTGAQLLHGVTVPFKGFPQVANTDIESLPAVAKAQIYDITSPIVSGDQSVAVATAQTDFNVNANNNATSTLWNYVSIGSDGTLSVEESSTPQNPFYSNGSQIACPAPTGTIFDDFSDNVNWFGCQMAQIFIYPHSQTEALAASSTALVEQAPPFVYAFDVLNAFSNEGATLKSATSSTDLSLNFGGIGVGNIIPTSSIKIVDNTAYADITGNASTSEALHDDLMSAQSFVGTALFIGIMIKIIFFTG